MRSFTQHSPFWTWQYGNPNMCLQTHENVGVPWCFLFWYDMSLFFFTDPKNLLFWGFEAFYKAWLCRLVRVMEQKNSITQSCFVSCDTNSTGQKLNLGIQTTLEADTSFISTGVITKLFGNITMDPAFCPRSWPFWLCCVVLAGEPNSKIFHRNKYQKKNILFWFYPRGNQWYLWCT